MNKDQEFTSIAVSGGGITGITAALELAKNPKLQVVFCKKEQQLGGLSTYYKWNDIICDRFYHVILPHDKKTL